MSSSAGEAASDPKGSVYEKSIRGDLVMKKIVVSMVVVLFTLLLVLSVGVPFSSAQNSVMDEGKGLMDKGKQLQEGGAIDKAATAPKGEAAGMGSTSPNSIIDEGKGLMDKGKQMQEGGVMDKAATAPKGEAAGVGSTPPSSTIDEGKGLINQGK
jgi:hypothetical protein